MDPATIHYLLGIKCISIKGRNLLWSYVGRVWIDSADHLSVWCIINCCVDSLVIRQLGAITFISYLSGVLLLLIEVILSIILWCSLVLGIDRGSLGREEIILSLSSGLSVNESSSCRWSVVTAIDRRADTLSVATFLLLHHEVLELVRLVIRYVDSLMCLPFLVHRVGLRSASWVAQEPIWSHHTTMRSSDIAVAFLRSPIAGSWICPIVIIVR